MVAKVVYRPFVKATEIAKEHIKKVVSEGDYTIDATVGNGHDTVFLAELVGSGGHVYGFDIQELAIKSTMEKLKENNYLDRVTLYYCGHEHMDKYIVKPVTCVMFNLGYLPKGNHDIITKPETTIEAIIKSLKLLKIGGIISVIVYPGHAGGERERDAVEDFFKNISKREVDIIKINHLNRLSTAPYVILAQKINHGRKESSDT